MNLHNNQLLDFSLNDLAKEFNSFLEKNRELLSIEELKLCYEILKILELSRKENSKTKIFEYISNVVSLIIKLFLNTDVIKLISKFL